jgi:tetrahydromethanopterin S-methyltransferase subunit D
VLCCVVFLSGWVGLNEAGWEGGMACYGVDVLWDVRLCACWGFRYLGLFFYLAVVALSIH